MFFKFHPLTFIQLETGLRYFYYLFSLGIFIDFENDSGFLKVFYLLFFIGYTLAYQH
jgi:hypothetical protein